jgi:hypothetical protein
MINNGLTTNINTMARAIKNTLFLRLIFLNNFFIRLFKWMQPNNAIIQIAILNNRFGGVEFEKRYVQQFLS